jgi:hypothetical protein
MNKQANNTKMSKTSGKTSGSSVLGEGRNKAAQVTSKESKFAKSQAYFDDLRQQYADGKLNKRQIYTIETRLPGFFDMQPFNSGESYFHGLLCQAARHLYNINDQAKEVESIIEEFAGHKAKKVAA